MGSKRDDLTKAGLRRKIDGKTYSAAGSSTKKDVAQQYADKDRKEGYSVRIIKKKGKYVLYRRK